MTGRDLPEELLSAYLDGELSPAERVAVDARLRDDRRWRGIFADVRDARDALRQLPERDAPPGYWAQVVAAVATADGLEGDRRAGVTSIARGRRRSGRWGALGGAAAAVVVAFLLTQPPSGHDVTPQIPALSDSHVGASSFGTGQVSDLVPAAVPVTFGR